MKLILLSMIFITIACQNQPSENVMQVEVIPQTPVLKTEEVKNGTEKYEYQPEYFEDSRRIGRRKQNRVEIDAEKRDGKIVVKLKFYKKANGNWNLKNEFYFEKLGELSLEPNIGDFNGDGFKDITFVANIAARGANQVRELLIFDPQKDELIHIKNSQEYPNLKFNPLLKCVDSLIFTGSTETAFLRIKADKLVQFASVSDVGMEIIVAVIDQNGEEKVIRREKRKDDGFYRYINYNPVMKYK